MLVGSARLLFELHRTADPWGWSTCAHNSNKKNKIHRSQLLCPGTSDLSSCCASHSLQSTALFLHQLSVSPSEVQGQDSQRNRHYIQNRSTLRLPVKCSLMVDHPDTLRRRQEYVNQHYALLRLYIHSITVAAIPAVVAAVAERPLYRQTAEQEEDDGRAHTQLITQQVRNLSCPSYSHLTLFAAPSLTFLLLRMTQTTVYRLYISLYIYIHCKNSKVALTQNGYLTYLLSLTTLGTEQMRRVSV